MQSYLKTRPVFIQLMLFIGMAFGVFLTLYLLLGSLLSQLTGISLLQMATADWSQPNPQLLTMMRGMLLIQFLGLFVIPSLLFAYFSDPRPMEYIGLKQKGTTTYWIIGIAALLLAIPMVQYTGELNRQVNFGPGMQQWLLQVWEEHRKTILLITHDVDEALFLSDRVYVLTPRPGRVELALEVDLPRPRSYALITTEPFVERKQVLLEHLGMTLPPREAVP